MIADVICFSARILSGLNVRAYSPFKNQPRIYFANHTSHLDFLMIWAALPKDHRLQTRPVAAKDYWEKPKFRNYLARQVFDAVLIERNHRISQDEPDDNPLQLMREVLQKKQSLILFPEGTRNTEEEMKPFKSGLFHLSRECPDVELIPVYLENLNRILPKGEFFVVPILGSVTFGRPLSKEPNETKNDFLTRAKGAIEKLKNV